MKRLKQWWFGFAYDFCIKHGRDYQWVWDSGYCPECVNEATTRDKAKHEARVGRYRRAA